MTSPGGEKIVSQEDPVIIHGGAVGMEANLQLILNLSGAIFSESGLYRTGFFIDGESFDGPGLFIDISEALVL